MLRMTTFLAAVLQQTCEFRKIKEKIQGGGCPGGDGVDADDPS